MNEIVHYLPMALLIFLARSLAEHGKTPNKHVETLISNQRYEEVIILPFQTRHANERNKPTQATRPRNAPGKRSHKQSSNPHKPPVARDSPFSGAPLLQANSSYDGRYMRWLLWCRTLMWRKREIDSETMKRSRDSNVRS